MDQGVQFEFAFRQIRGRPPGLSVVILPRSRISVGILKNPRARQYILKVKEDGSVWVTIPPKGNRKEAAAFAERHGEWLRAKIAECRQNSAPSGRWRVGTRIWYRGSRVQIGLRSNHHGVELNIGDQRVRISKLPYNLRPIVMGHLRQVASSELPERTRQFARDLGLAVGRVTVRNQRTRWGSCSPRGVISLNWRLVQTPRRVSDYIILHELTHLRHFNHSPKFWDQLAKVCSWYQEAEAWLKCHNFLLTP